MSAEPAGAAERTGLPGGEPVAVFAVREPPKTTLTRWSDPRLWERYEQRWRWERERGIFCEDYTADETASADDWKPHPSWGLSAGEEAREREQRRAQERENAANEARWRAEAEAGVTSGEGVWGVPRALSEEERRRPGARPSGWQMEGRVHVRGGVTFHDGDETVAVSGADVRALMAMLRWHRRYGGALAAYISGKVRIPEEEGPPPFDPHAPPSSDVPSELVRPFGAPSSIPRTELVRAPFGPPSTATRGAARVWAP